MAVAAIPAVMMGASTAIGVAGSISQGAGQAASGRYNAAVTRNNALGQKYVYDYNAQVANINANTALEQANWQADQTRRLGVRLGGQQRAYFGKYNLVGGSSADVMRDSAINNELQAMTEKYKGAVTANNYRNQAAQDSYRGQLAVMAGDQQAGLYEMGARSAMMRGMFSAAGSLLQGAGRTYGAYTSAYPGGATVPQWGGADDYPELIA